MNRATIEWIILGAVILLIGILSVWSIDYQETKCIADGGKWVAGMINGTYSYLCIPK
jgi:hypothetical protein